MGDDNSDEEYNDLLALLGDDANDIDDENNVDEPIELTKEDEALLELLSSSNIVADDDDDDDDDADIIEEKEETSIQLQNEEETNDVVVTAVEHEEEQQQVTENTETIVTTTTAVESNQEEEEEEKPPIETSETNDTVVITTTPVELKQEEEEKPPIETSVQKEQITSPPPPTTIIIKNTKKTDVKSNEEIDKEIEVSRQLQREKVQAAEEPLEPLPHMSALRNELKPLLEQKHIKEEQIRDICRRYMIQHHDSEKEDETVDTPTAVAATNIIVPVLPDDLRAQIWVALLGCWKQDTSPMDDWNGNKDLPNQKIVRIDCDRTRPGHEEFERDNGSLRDTLEDILTVYCKSRDVVYKQGLNDVLAPFLVCLKGRSKNIIFNSFYSLISKFLPSIFNDREFESLQCIMRFFNILLKYHDPQLSHYLNQFEMVPELYATPWFITLFARKLPVRVVYGIWDAYMIEGDPFLHYFVVLALLISHRDELLACPQESLPPMLASLSLNNMTKTTELLKFAYVYRSRTPLSFRKQMYEISFKITSSEEMLRISGNIDKLPCMLVPAEEIVQQLYHHTLEDGSIKFLILDCRSKREFNAGRLPCAIHLPAKLLHHPDELMMKLDSFMLMRGCHFCLLGRDSDDTTQYQFLMHFLQRQFPHMSVCEGGFITCHELVIKASKELVDHRAKQCLVCTPPSSLQKAGVGVRKAVHNVLTQSGGLFNSLKKKLHVSGSASSTTMDNKKNDDDENPTEEEEKTTTANRDDDNNAKKSNESGLSSLFSSWTTKKSSTSSTTTQQQQPQQKRSWLGRMMDNIPKLKVMPSMDDDDDIDVEPNEFGAIMNMNEWKQDETMTLFTARRVLRPKRVGGKVKLIPRILAVSEGYVVALEPLDHELRERLRVSAAPLMSTKPVDDATSVALKITSAHVKGEAMLKSKFRISDLARITSKRSLPSLLTFHWKASETHAAGLQMYLVDKYQVAIALIKNLHSQQQINR